MSLVIDLKISNAGGGLNPKDTMVIQRLEPITDTDEYHKYKVHTLDSPAVEFYHKYSDGAWRCVEIALQALNPDEDLALKKSIKGSQPILEVRASPP